MPVLRIEATVVSSVEPGSTRAFGTPGEAAAYKESIVVPSGLNMVCPITFFKSPPDAEWSSWLSVGIGEYFNSELGVIKYRISTYKTDTAGAQVDADYVVVVSGGGTYTVDLTLSQATYDDIVQCDYVVYNSNERVWYATGPIVPGVDPFGTPTYSVAYDFVSSTTSHVSARFVGSDAEVFDSSNTVVHPYPSDYPGEYASALVWGPPAPDIFWTQRILCEETQ